VNGKARVWHYGQVNFFLSFFLGPSSCASFGIPFLSPLGWFRPSIFYWILVFSNSDPVSNMPWYGRASSSLWRSVTPEDDLRASLAALRRKYFSHPSLVMYSFATPPTKLKLGQQIGGGLLITNHLDQSLWWANQKHWAAVRSYLLHSF
jgi:hypothetical protein